MSDPASAAPGRLEHVRQFVNTVDLESGEEQLATAAALRDWLAARSLGHPGARATTADLRRAIALREALRTVLLGHHDADATPDPDAVAVLDATARRARVELRFGGDGDGGGEQSHLAAARGGIDGALGELLAIVAAAQADGTWTRMKACPKDSCRWAFYDHSRNRSAVWCSMAVCGNRTKAASFRRRRRSGAGAPHE